MKCTINLVHILCMATCKEWLHSSLHSWRLRQGSLLYWISMREAYLSPPLSASFSARSLICWSVHQEISKDTLSNPKFLWHDDLNEDYWEGVDLEKLRGAAEMKTRFGGLSDGRWKSDQVLLGFSQSSNSGYSFFSFPFEIYFFRILRIENQDFAVKTKIDCLRIF